VTWRFLNTASETDLVTFGADETHVGTLIAKGTAEAPVTFTSSSPSPVPGDWAGIWLDAADGSQLDHVIVEYAGSAAGLDLIDCAPLNGNNVWPNTAAILVGNNDSGYIPPSNLITNSIIRNNAGSFAIDATWSSSSFWTGSHPNEHHHGEFEVLYSAAQRLERDQQLLRERAGRARVFGTVRQVQRRGTCEGCRAPSVPRCLSPTCSPRFRWLYDCQRFAIPPSTLSSTPVI
jgi:hypothetical protein